MPPKELSVIIQNHSFVGLVNEVYALLQYQTKLYLVDYQKIRHELFQILLLNARYFQKCTFVGLTLQTPRQNSYDHFANYGVIQLEEPLKLVNLIQIALQQNHDIPIIETKHDASAQEIANVPFLSSSWLRTRQCLT